MGELKSDPSELSDRDRQMMEISGGAEKDSSPEQEEAKERLEELRKEFFDQEYIEGLTLQPIPEVPGLTDSPELLQISDEAIQLLQQHPEFVGGEIQLEIVDVITRFADRAMDIIDHLPPELHTNASLIVDLWRTRILWKGGWEHSALTNTYVDTMSPVRDPKVVGLQEIGYSWQTAWEYRDILIDKLGERISEDEIQGLKDASREGSLDVGGMISSVKSILTEQMLVAHPELEESEVDERTDEILRELEIVEE